MEWVEGQKLGGYLGGRVADHAGNQAVDPFGERAFLVVRVPPSL